VTDRSRLLSQIADELEAVKAEMEERGSSMTDGAPLVNIRKTLARMKQEVGVVVFQLRLSRLSSNTKSFI
jgi:estrogen-related receptor beta like 1